MTTHLPHTFPTPSMTDLMVRLTPAFQRTSAIAPRSSVVDITTRKPLGLGIIADDVEPPERGDMGRSSAYHGPQAAAAELVASSVALLSEAQLAAAPSWRDLLEHGIGTALAAVFDGDDAVLDRVRELKAEVAKAHGVIREFQLERERDRATIAELKAKVSELDFVVERLKVENRGPPGVKGERGRDGADGARGERGEAGVKAAGFVLDIGGYAATLVSSDGAPAARLALRPMFERFAEEIAAEDEA